MKGNVNMMRGIVSMIVDSWKWVEYTRLRISLRDCDAGLIDIKKYWWVNLRNDKGNCEHDEIDCIISEVWKCVKYARLWILWKGLWWRSGGVAMDRERWVNGKWWKGFRPRRANYKFDWGWLGISCKYWIMNTFRRIDGTWKKWGL